MGNKVGNWAGRMPARRRIKIICPVFGTFWVKQDFLDVAIGPAINAFLETYRAVEHIRESESHGDEHEDTPDSAEQPKETEVHTSPVTVQPSMPIPAFAPPPPSDLNKINMDIRGDQVMISGLLDLKGIRLLEKRLAGLKDLLSPLDDSEGDDADDDATVN